MKIHIDMAYYHEYEVHKERPILYLQKDAQPKVSEDIFEPRPNVSKSFLTKLRNLTAKEKR